MPIKVLTPDVTSKIAAGEVIERPASVVKELLENSLDAGATEINAEIQNGGVTLIRITDNGCGMPVEEAELSFSRHATSKINSLDDLEHISTLGFRGEALPSIAAIAEVEMLTNDNPDKPGIFLSLSSGEVRAREKKSRPVGTTITVRHLFRNFPARLKFLKSPATESGHISTVISQYALSFPQVRFSLQVDGRNSVRTTGDASLRSAVSEIYGLETAQKMLEVSYSDGLMKIEGMSSLPSIQKSSRSSFSFFVNRRYVRNSLLSKAVEGAYAGLLMTGRHPVVVLNISIPPQEVDVNVHPTKQEVKFRNSTSVFTATQKALNNALERSPLPTVHMADEGAQPTSIWQRLPETPAAAARPGSPETQSSLPALPALRTLGQLSASYILAEGPEGLYLIDQHAAHERILFEKIQSQLAGKQPERQGMLEPLTIELTPSQDNLLSQSSSLLDRFGFTLENFGSRTWLIRAVPAMLNGSNMTEVINDLLDTIGSEKETSQRERKIAQSMACHGAIRAGQVLNNEEMRQLLRQLEITAQPRTCPHGRPTMIHLSSQQLKKEFGRLG